MRNDVQKVELTFMPIANDGSWICTSGLYAGTLAEWLAMYLLTIDDDCQFCRIVRFDEKNRYTYEYRACTAMRVTVTRYITKLT